MQATKSVVIFYLVSGITDPVISRDSQTRPDGGDLKFEDPSGDGRERETGTGRETQTITSM